MRERIELLERELKKSREEKSELNDIKQRYYNIVESIHDSIFLVEKETLRILEVNPAACELYGYSNEELLAMRTVDVSAEPEESTKAVQNELPTVPIRYHRKKDGTVFPVEITGGYFTIGDKTYHTAFIRDITKRMEAKESLLQSEATLRGIFEATPIGLCIMKDRIYQSANHAWYENFGYSPSGIIGNTTRMLYESEEEYERVGRELYKDLSTLGKTTVETRLRHKNGNFRDVILIAAPLQFDDHSSGAVVTIQDITEQKLMEEDLKTQRERLENIIKFLPDAILVIDREGKVLAWNRTMEYISGVKKEEMAGRGNYEYALPFYGERRPTLVDLALQPDPEMEQKYTTFKRSGDMLSAETFIMIPGMGETRHLSATASALRDEHGDIIAAIECIRDDTERKKLEERLKQAEKMEALGQLAGGVAHDLNNVLGVLVGYSELLLNGLQQNDKMRNYIERILESGKKAAAMISDLLTLARRGVVVSDVINLNDLVKDYLNMPEFEKLNYYHRDVKIAANLENGLLNIKGSPVHIGKVIMNLVSNAAEAITGPGTVTIKTESRYMDSSIEGLEEMPEGEYAVLSVIDTGSGISASDLNRIFEPFYTKKKMGRSGTGLGLSIVWGTVKDHNGYIDVKSKIGQGTTFSVYFPATREAVKAVGGTMSYEDFMGKGESILVVDDIKQQRELAETLLDKLGYSVTCASGGEEAIKLAKLNKFDLVMLDMIMDPGIDGLDTYKEILKINPGQKAIIVSGYTETDLVKKAQELGAGEFVQKPYILEILARAIKRELEGKGANR